MDDEDEDENEGQAAGASLPDEEGPEGEEEDDDGEEDDEDEDDDDDDDEDDSDEDEEAGIARRIASAHLRIRPPPPLHSSGDSAEAKPTPRDPKRDAQLRAQVEALCSSGKTQLEPIDCKAVTTAEFEERFARTPQIIDGFTAGWAAAEHWAEPAKLLRRWGEQTRIRVGDDEANEPVRMRLDDYLHYAQNTAASEANPLYMFDMRDLDRDERRRAQGEETDEPGVRIADYSPAPSYFTDDLFTALPAEQRPPHRWVLVGAEGSGSAIHKDPLHSSAWNTSLLGRKRWVLFPPETPRYHVAPRRVAELHPARLHGPAAWFAHVYPSCLREQWKAPKQIEVIQQPGQTMYVPAGWWHTVINLDPLSVAVTENFGLPSDFAHIRAALKAKRKDVDVEAWEREVRRRWGARVEKCAS